MASRRHGRWSGVGRGRACCGSMKPVFIACPRQIDSRLLNGHVDYPEAGLTISEDRRTQMDFDPILRWAGRPSAPAS